jgi:hypothetical protein
MGFVFVVEDKEGVGSQNGNFHAEMECPHP